jgi:ethanolamine transporter EutH
MSFKAEYIAAVIFGKLAAGICAVIIAQLMYNKIKKSV